MGKGGPVNLSVVFYEFFPARYCILSFLVFLFVCSVLVVFFVVFASFLFLCSLGSFVDVLMMFCCPAEHVSEWQPRILYGYTYSKSMDQRGDFTNYARGQLNTEKGYFPVHVRA